MGESKAESLFAYKRQHDTKRFDTLAELGEIDGELIRTLFANRWPGPPDA